LNGHCFSDASKQADGRKCHRPKRNPSGKQVSIGPCVHHLIGHNHEGRYDGSQEHGGQGVRRAEAVAQAFEVGKGLLGTLDARVCQGVI
jgi:hypothetical protein